jgi:hypothetical protein
MTRDSIILATLLCSLASSACAPDSRDAATETDFCSGTFDCSDGSGTERVTAARSGEACRVGAYWLDPDGSVRAIDWPLPTYDWVVNDDSVAICGAATACTVCIPAPVGPVTTTGGTCDGYRNCGSLSPGSCSTVDGCYLSLASTTSPDDDYCDGSPTACSSYDDESSCSREPGCSWLSR